MKQKTGRPKTFDEEEALSIAMHLFWTKGYEKTSLSDLIEAMQLSKSSFYQTFKSKKELYKRALGVYFDTNCNMLSQMQKHYSSKMILEMFIQSIFEEYEQNGDVKGCLLMNSGAECHEKYPDIISVVSSYYEMGIEQYAKLIEDAQNQGDIKNPMDAKEIATLFYSALTGMNNTIKAGAPKEAIVTIMESIKRLIS